ncbi:lysophospholipid acyltransferase family protein [Acidocella sp.]|uniref:lysophospholipid acyltransferase family protein n=1 Tax=Acidocella sp. TaxID=50710 RepID=UPI002608A86F|nr:lauroyl acyltransferase [Acidocella sp.]
MKVRLSHRVEAAIVWLLIKLLRPLSPATASRLGAAVAGAIGPFIPTSKLADKNLRLAMPELNAAQRRQIVKECWQNLGATAAELVRIGDIREIPRGAPGPGYTIIGWDEHVAPALAHGGPSVFFTGHIGNWEILPASAHAHGLEIGYMYRAASNKLVDAMVMDLREANFGRKITMFAKGAAGGRAAYAHLLKKGHLGLLVDQKLDTGLAVPFFGHSAQTMDAMASFALKFRCPVIPTYVERIGPARLLVICEAPLPLPDTGDKAADALALTTTMNEILERWIRAKPGAWLWLHRRWPKR